MAETTELAIVRRRNGASVIDMPAHIDITSTRLADFMGVFPNAQAAMAGEGRTGTADHGNER